MKKENFVIGLVVVGTIAFFLGRMSVATHGPTHSEKPASSPTAAAPAAAPAPAAAAPAPAAAVPAAAPAAAVAAAAAPAAAPAEAGGVAAAPSVAAAPAAPAAAGALPGSMDASPRKGPEAAKVTILEVSDFQCPFCSRGKATMQQVHETWPNDVAIVFKHNPLGFHDRAMPTAIASLAAHRQGKFWELHDKFFDNQKALSDADIERYATEIGLDMAKFKADMADASLKAQAENEQKAAVALGMGGTPAFFINGKTISGAQPFDNFKAAIEAELKEADSLIAAGTALADVHQKRTQANLGDKAAIYWDSLKGGKPAPAGPPPAAEPELPPVDPTVWKVDIFGHEPIWGKADAPVTMVIYSEFQCPFCKRVEDTLKQVRETYPNDVRIVWKNNALPFHNRALPAAMAAMAAHEQGKFWEYHEKVFAEQQDLEDAKLEAHAVALGLDIAKWKAHIAAQTSKPAIDKDMEQAGQVNARGTPNFFINGRNLVGAVPFDAFKKLIDEELGKAKAKIAAGTPATDVYAAIIKDGRSWEPLDPKVNTFTLDGYPFLGAENGDVVIVEFSDFQCPFCSRVGAPLKALIADPDVAGRVKVVFKNFPLGFHEQAKPAAVAALAAHRQGKFWEMHDKLFAGQQELAADKYTTWAQELGLDMAKFEADVKDPALGAMVEKDMAEGQAAGLEGTPTVYINGRKFEPTSGFSPEAFKPIIAKYFPKK